MRHYITFSLCDETGEADLTPKSRETVEELIGLGLISADWFGDIHGISERLYERAFDGFRKEAGKIAVKAHGKKTAKALGYDVD
jgi:hypothetical protein